MRNRREAALSGWRKPSAYVHPRENMRACADCEEYSHVASMITKSDGRVICRSCQTTLDRLAAEKAQPDLFVEQKGLFQ
jgi:hypothetical protein